MHHYILDSTLREGELFTILPQSSKLRLAEALCDAGVEFIEVTLAYPPRTSLSDTKELISAIKERGAVPVVHARACREDMDSLLEHNSDACAFYIAVSSLHRNYKLHGLSFDDALERLKTACEFARSNGFKYIRATLEDASRLFIEEREKSVEIILDSIEKLRSAGATIVSLPDTSGIMSTRLAGMFFSSISRDAALPLAAHFHNDYGMASANTVEAALSGARELHCTVMGIGDRNGIADMYEVCSILNDVHGLDTGIQRQKISKLYEVFSSVSRMTFHWRHPLSQSARTIRAGVHQSMVVRKPEGYLPAKKLEHDFSSPIYAVSPFLSHRVVEEILSRHRISLPAERTREIAEQIASEATKDGRTSYLVAKIIERQTGIKIREEEITSLFGKERCYILMKLKPQLDAGDVITFLNRFEDVETVDEVYGDVDMVIQARVGPSSSLIKELKHKFSSNIVEMKVLLTD